MAKMTLDESLAHFFSSEPYILQMCKNELVLIPMHMHVAALFKFWFVELQPAKI